MRAAVTLQMLRSQYMKLPRSPLMIVDYYSFAPSRLKRDLNPYIAIERLGEGVYYPASDQ